VCSYAVRQGKPLFDNLCLKARGAPLQPFVQQKSGLAIIGCGDGYAIASKGGWLKLEGKWVWKVKDWIDRKWMSMYNDLPDIELMMEAARRYPDPHALNAKADALQLLARARGPDALDVLAHAAMRCGG
jgi:selenide,water dikinase